jgi:hypothetical protein
MKPRVLFLITSDPRTSARPAEAIRIAAGVGAWRKVEVDVGLREAAVLALSEFPDGLVDEENYTTYLPLLRELGRPIYVQQSSRLLSQIGQASLPFEAIADERFAELALRSCAVLRF